MYNDNRVLVMKNTRIKVTRKVIRFSMEKSKKLILETRLLPNLPWGTFKKLDVAKEATNPNAIIPSKSKSPKSA